MIAPKNDHLQARGICNILNTKEPFYFHAGETTDLTLGGGCPRCNKYLRMLAAARIDGLAKALEICEIERELHAGEAKKMTEPTSLFTRAAGEGARGCAQLIKAAILRLEREATP